MVEDALDRIGKTLAYIRLRLAEDPLYLDRTNGEMKVKGAIEEANLLCNINYYGAYLQGARRMALVMQEHRLLNLPTLKGGKKHDAVKPADKHDVKALVELMNESPRNFEWFLHGWPNNVEIFISHEEDRKGKIIGAKAKFVRKEVKYRWLTINHLISISMENAYTTLFSSV